MGNQESTNHSSSGGGKVILWDGTVHRLEDPGLTAAELMLEHPQQVVVEFDSKASGKRPTPLPADQELDPGKIYLMLPVKRGKPVSLSAEEAQHVLFTANSVLRSRSLLPSSSRLLPLFARLCILGPGGHELAPREGNREAETSAAKRCALADPIMSDIMDGRPEYLSRQLSGKGWKPSLDTITEKRIQKKEWEGSKSTAHVLNRLLRKKGAIALRVFMGRLARKPVYDKARFTNFEPIDSSNGVGSLYLPMQCFGCNQVGFSFAS